MQSCPELYVDRGASVSYNFLHLTIQEYLAAYHISLQSRDHQVAFMRKCIESKDVQTIATKGDAFIVIRKLEVVLRFLAGLSNLGRDLWDVVRGFASEDKPKHLRSRLEEETNFIKLDILHLLFECQDPSALNSVITSDSVGFYHLCFSMHPFDWYVLGYCITHSKRHWNLVLHFCELESIEIFLRGLQQDQSQLPSTGLIKGMWLCESKLGSVHLLLENMPQMLVFQRLTHLCFLKCHLTSETCNQLSTNTDLLKNLEYLDLSYNNICKSGAVQNLITSLTTIRHLNLTGTGIGFEDCKALSNLLASSNDIKILDVRRNFLPPDSTQLIIDGLSYNSSLEKLSMCDTCFSSSNILNLASVLKVHVRLKELNLWRCNIQSSDSVKLANALEENTTTQLNTLILSNNPIGSEGAVAFASMLAKNKSLAKLDMNDCSIYAEGAISLANAMVKNSVLTKFSISYSQIGSEGAMAFASMLKKNRSLKKLELIHESVGVEGGKELIESLKHNTTLERLSLSINCKPPYFSSLDKQLQDRVKYVVLG